MKVSNRLEKIAEAAGNARLLADVGCDHGYTALCALRERRAERVLCMDINPGPLSTAAANLQKTGFLDRAAFLLSDGLRAAALSEDALSLGEREKRDAFRKKMGEKGDFGIGADLGLGEALSLPDVIVLSGMGGQLITKILSLLPTNGAVCTEETEAALLRSAKAYLSGVERLILSPQSEPERVRELLWEKLDFHILDEKMLCDEGKYYLILTAAPGRDKDYALEDENRALKLRYGTCLYENRDEVFHCYLEEEQRKIKGILETLSDGGRRAELSGQIEEIEFFLKHWDEKRNT